MKLSTGKAVVICLITIVMSVFVWRLWPDRWAEAMIAGMFAGLMLIVVVWGWLRAQP